MLRPFKKYPVMRFSVEGYLGFSDEVRSFPNLAKVSFALVGSCFSRYYVTSTV
jgi:hypothetical protein